MSIWEDCNFEKNIREILESAQSEGHHFGRQFLSAYQITIEFASKIKYQNDFKKTGMEIGGSGAGNKSMARYIANELSRRIKKVKGEEPEIKDIEGAFLSNNHLFHVIFKDNNGKEISSSYNDWGYTNGTGHSFSLFRIIGE
ncbi:MAG: hypothetical protein ACYCTB_05825 [bacterium]